MSKLYAVDTNVVLNNIESLQDYKIVLLSHVLRELEKHKSSKNKELAYNARQVSRYIKENENKFEFDSKDYDGSLLHGDYSQRYEDNNILMACYENGYGLITEDVLLRYKAKGHGIEVLDIGESNESYEHDDYTGFKTVYMTNDEYTDFYKNKLDKNVYDLLINQYLVIIDKDTGKELDALRYDGQYHIAIRRKGFKSEMLGSFKPKDIYQSCAIDSLNNNQMTLLSGRAGTGKTLLALNYAFSQIEKGIYDKLICFVNPVPVKNAQEIGFYKGDKDEKLKQSAVGAMLASKFGHNFMIDTLISNEKLMLLPFVDIRGFDTTGMRAIVIFLEAQNLNRELAKLGIQRLGEDSKLIIDGDYNTQVDSSAYEGASNGMRRTSEVFRGFYKYGQVNLPNIYRSELANKAEEM